MFLSPYLYKISLSDPNGSSCYFKFSLSGFCWLLPHPACSMCMTIHWTQILSFFLKQTELRIILLHNTGPLCFRLTLYVCCYRKLSNMVNPLMDLSDLQMKFWKLVSLWSSIGNFRQVQSKVIIHIYLLCLTPVYKVVILYSVSKLGLGVEIVMCRFVLGSVYAYGEYWSRFEIMPFD